MRTKKAKTNGAGRTRDEVVRVIAPEVAVRAEGDGEELTLHGRFAPYGEWAEINSVWEGHFLERFAPGALKKTITDQQDKLRVLFQHGMDPTLGDKPIAEIKELRDEPDGAYYEARLFEGVPPLIVEGLRAGQYGASHRFHVIREDFDKKPAKSDHNPDGLPERTVTEAAIREFGPVTWGAYDGATAGVRSITDDYIVRCAKREPERLRGLLKAAGIRAVDTEDIDCLAQMLSLATDYIEEQDEPDEQGNIPKMQGVIQTLTALMDFESKEDEPDEPEDEDEMAGGRSTIVIHKHYGSPDGEQRADSVTDKSWDGSAGRFSDEQYARSAVLDRATCTDDMKDAPAKQRYSLPVREPDGTLNRNAVHAAAGRIDSADACADAKTAAAKTLVGHYRNSLKEDPPEGLLKAAGERSTEEPEAGDAGDRSTSPPGREPLRPYRGKETTSWPRL